MVTIPTTDRQFYDTQAKESGLATYSKALAPAVELFNTVIQEEQKSKIALLKSEASLKLNDVTFQWRMDNMTDPNSPKAIQELNQLTEETLSGYREQIDPMYRSLWDTEINKVKHSMDRENMRWRFNTTVSNIGKNYTSTLGNIQIEQNTENLPFYVFAGQQRDKFISTAKNLPGITEEQYSKDANILFHNVYNREAVAQFQTKEKEGDLTGMLDIAEQYSSGEGFTPKKEIQDNMSNQIGLMFKTRFADNPSSVSLEDYERIKKVSPENKIYTANNNKTTVESHYANVKDAQEKGYRPQVADVSLSEKAIEKYLQDSKKKNEKAFGITKENAITNGLRTFKNGLSWLPFVEYTPPKQGGTAEQRKQYEQAIINDAVSMLHKIDVDTKLNGRQRASLRSLVLKAIEDETLRDDYDRMIENLYSLAGSKENYYNSLLEYDAKQRRNGTQPFSNKISSLIENTALALSTSMGDTIREEAIIRTTIPPEQQKEKVKEMRKAGMTRINNIMDGYVKALFNGLYGVPMKDLETPLKAGETILRLPALNGLEVKYMGYGSEIFVKVN